MSTKTIYFQEKLVDWIFRGQAFSLPSHLYFGLLVTNTSGEGSLDEVYGGGYARVAVPRSLSSFAEGFVTTNSPAITFPSPTADWGEVTHVGVFDSANEGELLIVATLDTPKIVISGSPAPVIASGDFFYQEDFV